MYLIVQFALVGSCIVIICGPYFRGVGKAVHAARLAATGVAVCQVCDSGKTGTGEHYVCGLKKQVRMQKLEGRSGNVSVRAII